MTFTGNVSLTLNKKRLKSTYTWLVSSRLKKGHGEKVERISEKVAFIDLLLRPVMSDYVCVRTLRKCNDIFFYLVTYDVFSKYTERLPSRQNKEWLNGL